MGLAGPKTRRKLANDPNNTKWTRDTSSFGHKILRSHGWEPGQYLGAQNIAQTELHSVASAAPIQVLLKDDNLGLGAKKNHRQNDECTGLDVFKDLLGRLNGKSEDTIEQERKVRSDIKISLYVERRFGTMRFVKGGLLVGDQMKEETPAIKVEEDVKIEEEIVLPTMPETVEKKRKSKKRKADDTIESPAGDNVQEKKKRKKTRVDVADASSDESRSKPKREKSKDEKRKEKKDKKRRKEREASNAEAEMPSDAQAGAESAKLTKEERRRLKRERKEKKRQQAATEEATSVEEDNTQTSAAATPLDTAQSTPIASGTSTPLAALSARHRARSRNIASKRQAIADMAALNQIFMVKAV